MIRTNWNWPLALSVGTVCFVLPDSRPAIADTHCGDIVGVPVGEMRYKAVSGTDEAYANAYADGFDEITIGSGYVVAGYGLRGSPNTYESYAYVEDTSSDCGATTFTMKLDYSNSVSGTCPSGYDSKTFSYVVDRCHNPYSSSDVVYAGDRLNADMTNEGYQRYWQGTLTVSGDEAEVTDTGCWQILSFENGSCDWMVPGW